MNQAVEVEQVLTPKKKANFGQDGLFVIGLNIWDEIYNHEKCGINEMCVFLALACGTDQSQSKSVWSIGAVKRHIGLTDVPAKKALQNLIDAGFVTVIKPVLKQGDRPIYEIKAPERGEDEAIFLPNGVVYGVNKESSPVNRLKKRNDKRLLYYFIRLYYFQDMRETGCISGDIIFAEGKGDAEKPKTELITLINRCINFLEVKFKWMTRPNTDFGRFGEFRTIGRGKHERQIFEAEHCPKLNERGTWVILRPLWDMKLIEPVFFMTDSPDDAPDDEKVMLYELYTEAQKAAAKKILSGRYTLESELKVKLESVNYGVTQANFAVGFVDSDYANASIKGMFRLKYRTKNPYSKNRIKDQSKFERELMQKAEKHL